MIHGLPWHSGYIIGNSMRKEKVVKITPVLDLERPLFGRIVRQVVKIRTEDLEDCLEQQRMLGNTVGLGQLMLRRGLITRTQIMQVLRFQANWVATAMRGDMGPSTFPCQSLLSLCLPAYNEEANIEDTLDAAGAILPEFVRDFEVIVVDDGSRDQTAAKVAAYAAAAPWVRLVQHERNRGYGAAVTSGLRAASGDLVAFTDADGQFSLLDLPWFLTRLGACDLIIGYRYRRADPWHRRLNAWSWNRLIRILLGVRVRDLDCAFKLFRRDIIDRLSLTATGAAINAEILVQCTRAGLRIGELPVSHYPRCHGAPTGAALRVIWRAFRELPQLWKYRSLAPLIPRSDAQAPAALVPGLNRGGLPDSRPLNPSDSFPGYDPDILERLTEPG
jgi:hypothetical protein